MNQGGVNHLNFKKNQQPSLTAGKGTFAPAATNKSATQLLPMHNTSKNKS